MTRSKTARARPLADPKRARFARAALAKRAAQQEREALKALGDRPELLARNLERIQELQLLLAEPE